MTLKKEFAHYIDELITEINFIENTERLTLNQKASIEEAKKQIEESRKANNPVNFWSHINLARAQRAYYLPDSFLPAMVNYELKRNLDVLDPTTREGFRPDLENIIKDLNESPTKEVVAYHRKFLFYYLQKVGRKWNSINSGIDLKITSFTILVIICVIAIILLLYTLKSNDVWLSALFGSVGGLVGAINKIQGLKLEFRSKWLTILSFMIRPLTGAIISIILFLFLLSNISIVHFPVWDPNQPLLRTAWIGAVSFAGGLSERFVLGKMDIYN
jgi:hypothetical protein